MAKVIENSRLTLIEQVSFGKQSKGVFRCICGVEKVLHINSVRMGKTRSCGCLQRENRKNPKSHGMSKHPIYTIWFCMKARCYNKKCQDYPNYGGRGVVMCQDWLNDFMSFYNWAIQNGWQKGLQIDKDIKARCKGVESLMYSPSMCTFVTPKENSNNRRSNKIIEFGGKKQSASMWAREIGISVNTIYARIRYGWPVDKYLTEPLKLNKK